MTRNGPGKDVYARRRKALSKRLGDSKSVVFVPGAPQVIYASDVHYRYRPSTYIRYLSGYEEPAALLLSHCCNDEDGFTLFVQPSDPSAETWTGRRPGVDGALRDYGPDRAYALDETYDVLARHLRHAEAFFYDYSRDASVNQRVLDLVHTINSTRPRSGGSPLVVTAAGALLDEMRLVKKADEIAVLREACRISAGAHRQAMETVVAGMYEYQVEALVEHAFRDAGCAGPAYGTIAAAGANATVLHYTKNDERLDDGELLLLDAGGEYGGYCADITRTMPVAATYSKSQAALYDVVLAAQHAAIATVAPGTRYDQVHKAALEVLVQGMIDLGLLEGTRDECIETEAYKPYFMHGTSHWLGMEVHDVGSYRNSEGARTLDAGILLTVEPGIYVREDASVPEAYRGIGIRIEDDVLVTENGSDVLTADAPTARDEIERLRRKACP